MLLVLGLGRWGWEVWEGFGRNMLSGWALEERVWALPVGALSENVVSLLSGERVWEGVWGFLKACCPNINASLFLGRAGLDIT